MSDQVDRGVGASIPRPDGPAKVAGRFDFASDLTAAGMVYGRTLRSPHPRAFVRSVRSSKAEAMRARFSGLWRNQCSSFEKPHSVE